MDNINTENKLVNKKKKIERYCLNLECQNEQLNLLIDNLHQISHDRETKILSKSNESTINANFRDILIGKSSVQDKLEVAQNKKNYIETCILKLKEQIKQIDSCIKSKK